MREEYPPYRSSQKEDLIYLAIGAAAGAVCAFLFYKSASALLLCIPLAFLALRLGRRKKGMKMRQKLTGELRDYLISLSSHLRAGYALENAMIGAEKEIRMMYGSGSAMGTEAAEMVRKLRLQTQPELLWKEFAQKTGLRDGEQLQKVFGVAKRQGGDYLPVLKAMIRIMDERNSIRQEIETLLTAQRLEYTVMCLVPAGMLLYLNLGTPEMMSPLYGEGGAFVMSAMLLLYLSAILWGNRMLEKSYEPE